MQNPLREIILRAHTALFGQKMCQTLIDMAEASMELQANSLTKGYYRPTGSLTVFTPFSGVVQGDFIVSMADATAALLAGQKNFDEATPIQREMLMEISAEFMSEALNVAAGRTLPELRKQYGALTLAPACSVFGKIRFPDVLSGSISIVGQAGSVSCTLSINMASLEVFGDTPQPAPYASPA